MPFVEFSVVGQLLNRGQGYSYGVSACGRPMTNDRPNIYENITRGCVGFFYVKQEVVKLCYD